jgi:hypothetical protein
LKVAAYQYAVSGDRKPAELMLMDAIDRFGVRAVTGRDVLAAGEILRARHAEFIVKSYRARAEAESWPEFINSNPAAALVLGEAERLANGE